MHRQPSPDTVQSLTPILGRLTIRSFRASGINVSAKRRVKPAILNGLTAPYGNGCQDWFVFPLRYDLDIELRHVFHREQVNFPGRNADVEMIPQQLVLRNFLSYRQATLPFRGLHLACICGANGAGKSSLLEAIAWALWGQSRASREDDVIYYGEVEAYVDFEFTVQGQGYRVVRVRRRQQSTVLELQVQTAVGYSSLTQRSLRATQEKIIQILRLDYPTFVNSAYLRQGRADEFMAKRPSERKQLLAALLGLEQYEPLAEAARDRAREYKAQITLLEQRLSAEATQLAAQAHLQVQHQHLTARIAQQRQQRTLADAMPIQSRYKVLVLLLL
jgi:exonuclease SbcC